jgi:Tol biopolymer transport system component
MSIAWRDRAGKLLETPGGQADWQLLGPRDGLRPSDAGIGFEVSPDGGRLAYVTGDKPVQDAVWVLELASGRRTRIPLSTAAMPRWSSDGKHLYYTNPKGICRKGADGLGEEELVMKGSVADLVQSVSPDGKNLLYGNVDIMKLSLTGERKPEAYLQTKNRETGARFSPDGRWVAYDSDESGRHEIYVQGFPERRGKWPISGELGGNPQWRADGKELYWIGEGGTLMAASMDLTGAAVRPGRPEVLFKTTLGFYQPSRDGRRFLVYEMEAIREDWPMAVQLNWAGSLRK